ncbi:erythroid membrane-associated protein-like [Chanos chanos]|uniref:Erythroid membrane-associated protein-like n=1 Tax=Chanos chanos TaxID=29144 RepID=A0A6J2WHD0_CHACN|nr:erythroid membrane-associated protein-like [Chanos chanos]
MGDESFSFAEMQPLKQEIEDEETRSQEKCETETVMKKPETADKETNTDTAVIPGWDKMPLSKERLTLDKTTCHKGLTVKKKGKEVSFDKGVFKHSISSESMVDVLCKEMFKSGCHYWEVIVLDVKKGPVPKLSWYVGVTSHEEKERKKESLTPENGYWVLQYERGKGFYVNTGLPTPVLVRDSFSTLGVYLDMYKKTLSFYDVDSKSHLYTFTEVKSENVLTPLFSPGDRCDHSLTLK